MQKSALKPLNQSESGQISFYLTLQLNKKDNFELIEKKEPKYKRF